MLVRAVPADPTPFSLVRGQNVVRMAEVSLRNHRGDGVVRLHSHNRLRVGLVERSTLAPGLSGPSVVAATAVAAMPL